MKNSIKNPKGLVSTGEQPKQVVSGMRRNSQHMQPEDKNMNIINIDDQNSNFDHGFDPPTKIDSGRGNTTSFGGSGYMNRGGENIHLGQHDMFDIEEDAEDQFDHHQTDSKPYK